MFSEIKLPRMSFVLLVNILLSEEDCQALHKDPTETVVDYKEQMIEKL